MCARLVLAIGFLYMLPATAAPPQPAPLRAAPAAAGGLTVRLVRLGEKPGMVSFGVPLHAGALADLSTVRVTIGGHAVTGLTLRPLLRDPDAAGRPRTLRAFLVQFPATALTGETTSVQIEWSGTRGPNRPEEPRGTPTGAPSTGAAAEETVPPGTGPEGATATEGAPTGASTPAEHAPAERRPGPERPTTGPLAYEAPQVSRVVDETVDTAARTIVSKGARAVLEEGPRERKTLFSGREPLVMAIFPEGYLAATGLLGEQVPASTVARSPQAGLAFFSEAARRFGLAALHLQDYPLNPTAVPAPEAAYEAWLYDRCSTFLSLYAHLDDARFLRHALRTCSHYAGQIETTGKRAGLFKGKKDADPKYSHLRGLYAYFALTGDEQALAAGRAIADFWEHEPSFVLPYRAGHTRAPDHLWTERLLATALEGVVYGQKLIGAPRFLTAARELVDTAFRHVTGDAATLARINPGVGPFPPQNCFVHSASQQAEGDEKDPWCSAWMTELAVDALLRYQEMTGDARVDEIFVRLSRFLRDVGTQYFRADADKDFFLHPKARFDLRDKVDTRRIVPLYGAGLRPDGSRFNDGNYDDFEHCADATALTAAALRALRRQGKFDQHPVGPFPSEGSALVQLHHELAFCAKMAFEHWHRPDRAPATWTAEKLTSGLANPTKFIEDNKIGYPVDTTTPARKLSWWFNMSLLQFGLLSEAQVAIPRLTPGKIQPHPGS